MKNRDLKIGLIFAIIGLIAGAFLGIYQMASVTQELKRLLISKVGSPQAVVALSAVQTGVYAFISSFVGLKIARKVNLELNGGINGKTLLWTILVGALTAFIISAADKVIFAPYLPASTTVYRFSWLYLVSAVLYGGIIEELMLRLLIMSSIVFLLWRLLTSPKERAVIPRGIYMAAVFLAAILFGAGHLPATAQQLGLSAPTVIRALLLNGIGGIGYGILFWKRGLSAAICAHILTHLFNQLLFMPLFFS